MELTMINKKSNEKHFVVLDYVEETIVIATITRVAMNGGALLTISKKYDEDARLMLKLNKIVQLDNELFTMLSEM